MAKIYFRQIREGHLTISEVPERWRDTVQAMLDADSASQS